MRLVTFIHHGMTGVGLVDPHTSRIKPLDLHDGRHIPDMLTLIREGLDAITPSVMRPALPLVEVSLLAPIHQPARNIFCVGKNYRRHAEEFARPGRLAVVERRQAARDPRDQHGEGHGGEAQDQVVEHERAEARAAGGDHEGQRDAFGRHHLAPALEVEGHERAGHPPNPAGRRRKAKK